MIRIAKGPPTCEGWYWCKFPDIPWRIYEVYTSRYTGELHISMETIPEFLAIVGECQWSTRIPDPIEETDGETPYCEACGHDLTPDEITQGSCDYCGHDTDKAPPARGEGTEQ